MIRFKIKNFVDTIMPHIMIDRAFQRKVCWSEKTCREFILSANRGRAFYPIVVADVASGFIRSENSGSEYSLLKYEEAKRLRKDYISLDGQNRSMAWKKLFNDEVHLKGSFIDADGEVRVCELKNPVGNLRNYDYDIRKILNKRLKHNCTCTHACFQNASIDVSPVNYIKQFI